ncbi:hypothetical protein L1887_57041 [Cichorium endivia]|nr:hypothetical protein L1887_57041 [Cichorium endivia]
MKGLYHNLTGLGGAKKGDEVDAFGDQHIADLDGARGAAVTADASVAQCLKTSLVLAEHLEDEWHGVNEIRGAVAGGLGDEVRLRGARVDVEAATMHEVSPGDGASETVVDGSRAQSIVRHVVGDDGHVSLVSVASKSERSKTESGQCGVLRCCRSADDLLTSRNRASGSRYYRWSACFDLVCLRCLVRAEYERLGGRCLDEVHDGRDRIVRRNEHDTVSKPHERHLRDQMVEARLCEERDVTAGIVLASDRDVLGVVGSGCTDAAVELGSSNVLPFEGLGRLDVRDANLVAHHVDERVDERIEALSALERGQEALTVGDEWNGHWYDGLKDCGLDEEAGCKAS